MNLRITAQQLNRTASAIIDSAIQAKKEDVTRLIGRDGVAGAWEIKNFLWSPRTVRYEKKTTLIAGTSRQVWNTNRIVIYGAKGNSGGIVIKFQNRENPQPRYMTKKKGDDIYDCIRFNDYRKHIFTRNCE